MEYVKDNEKEFGVYTDIDMCEQAKWVYQHAKDMIIEEMRGIHLW